MKLAAGILFLVFFLAIAAPLLTQYPASGQTFPDTDRSLMHRHHPPSSAFLFGTDELGRDVWTRTLYGARISLAVGIIARLFAVLLGTLLGAMAGYYGGRIDFLLSRVIEIFLAIPSLILAIAIGVALGPGLQSVLIAIVAVSWVDIAVLIRAVSSSVARRDFVLAARSLGDSHARILMRQVIPNCLSAILVSFSFGIASAVMIEASLSFLGLGATAASPDLPTWGWMIYTSDYHLSAAPWAAFGPCFLLALTVLGWNRLGDALRDRFDIKGDLC